MRTLVKEKKTNIRVAMLLKGNVSTDNRVLKEADTLAANGFIVFVLSCIKKKEKLRRNFRFEVFPIKYPLNNSNIIYKIMNHACSSIRLIIEGIKVRPTIVHSHDHNTLFEGFIISLFSRSKFIYDSHELWYGRVPVAIGSRKKFSRILMAKLERLLEKIYCLRANLIITVCDSIGKEINKNLIKRKRTITIKNVSLFQDRTEFTDNAYYGLDPKIYSKKVLLYRGNVDLGLDNFDYKALKCLKGLDNICVVVLGSIKDEDKNYIYDYLGLTENSLLFIDKVPQEEMLKYIYFADIGLYLKKNTCSNINYSLPNKIFEYVVYGKPIISSNLKEVGDMIRNHNIGVTYNEEDAASLLSAIQKLLEKDYYRLIQKNVEKSYRLHFNWQIEGKKLVDAYKMLN